MEEQKKFLLNEIDNVKHYFEMSPEVQRYEFYKTAGNRIKKRVYTTKEYLLRDDKLYYSSTDYRMHFNKKLYLRRIGKKGLTFDYTTKKLNIWFGKNITELIEDIKLLLIDFKKEWVCTEGFLSGQPTWMTKTLLEKILADKITNPSEASQFIVKSLRLKGISPDLLRKMIQRGGSVAPGHHNPELGVYNKSHFLQLYHIASFPNSIFEIDTKKESSTLSDMVEQAYMLDKKIDFYWSDKRLESEHTKWTNEIMALEIKSIGDESVEYKKVKLPKELKLLSTKKEVYEEGTTMHHCIYTNYWDKIKNKNYFVIHSEIDDIPVTVGIKKSYNNDEKLVVDQMYKKFDKPVPENTKEKIKNILNKKFLNTFYVNNVTDI